MSSLKERVKSLQADTTNTDTALTTLEEALAEKLSDLASFQTHFLCFLINLKFSLAMRLGYKRQKEYLRAKEKRAFCTISDIV